ncbi:putative phosphoglycerate mutase [Nocardioides albertanoniae]|uniref:Putative phosphoglycerate mutase n=1 Tax=Nocardioides albertanoniae TaxID=1175486 RepID=A0A543A899_9ACTN|nr:histidine phosphatase family protein [Nocardioides albertanoniae]TQL68823.1 putative phosphoglycerate mutase [Nocardioides albertanoniae]
MIHLVRHGEAAGAEGADPGLSDLGRRQVTALANRLSFRPVRQILHGPSRRTTQTAQVITEVLGAGAQRCDALADRTPVPSFERRGDYPTHRWGWLEEVPEAERDIDGAELTAAWHKLWFDHHDDEVVLVTHAFVAAWFVREVLGAPPATWMRIGPFDNATLTTIGPNLAGEPVVETFNAEVILPV